MRRLVWQDFNPASIDRDRQDNHRAALMTFVVTIKPLNPNPVHIKKDNQEEKVVVSHPKKKGGRFVFFV